MCGRFTLIHSVEVLEETFGIEEVLFTPPVSYNVAPGQTVAAIIGGERKRLVGLQWGLVPSWARGPGTGRRMINARAETVFQKPSFRRAFRKGRCVIPASGFYEWKKDGKGKQPYYIYMESGEAFPMAGLFERWVSPAGDVMETCAIITTEAVGKIAEIHGRMPVILNWEGFAAWLDPTASEGDLIALLTPHEGGRLSFHKVSVAVNSPRFDSPECIREA